MRRWLWWFLLVPQGFLLVGFLQDLGLPPLDMAVLSSLYLSWFAQRSALPFLLLGVAIGRTLVDEATLPIHILVIGIPVALLLPLWQSIAAALLAIAMPKLAGLFGRAFDQPSVSSMLNGWQVVWSALLVPPLLSVLRFLPPFAGFTERDGLEKLVAP
jgi:hypothetical protein